MLKLYKFSDFQETSYEHGHRWGGWQLDCERLTLDLVEPPRGGRQYEVDLETIDSAWDLLDIAVQVAGKTWCDAATAGHLLQALNDLFLPQHRMRDGDRRPAKERLADKIEWPQGGMRMTDRHGRQGDG